MNPRRRRFQRKRRLHRKRKAWVYAHVLGKMRHALRSFVGAPHVRTVKLAVPLQYIVLEVTL